MNIRICTCSVRWSFFKWAQTIYNRLLQLRWEMVTYRIKVLWWSCTHCWTWSYSLEVMQNKLRSNPVVFDRAKVSEYQSPGPTRSRRREEDVQRGVFRKGWIWEEGLEFPHRREDYFGFFLRKRGVLFSGSYSRLQSSHESVSEVIVRGSSDGNCNEKDKIKWNWYLSNNRPIRMTQAEFRTMCPIFSSTGISSGIWNHVQPCACWLFKPNDWRLG